MGVIEGLGLRRIVANAQGSSAKRTPPPAEEHRKDWEDERGLWKDRPQHDDSSYAADPS